MNLIYNWCKVKILYTFILVLWGKIMELNKTIEINNLIDMYGKFLTDKQFNIMTDYFKNNYSLSEIADNLNITKQAVKYAIGLATDRLKELDDKLNLISIKSDLNEFLLKLDSRLQNDLQDIINKIGE